MQQLHDDCDKQPVKLRDGEKLVATPWDGRDGERKPATIGDSERHADTQWDCQKQ